jgi:hypothetical protein
VIRRHLPAESSYFVRRGMVRGILAETFHENVVLNGAAQESAFLSIQGLGVLSGLSTDNATYRHNRKHRGGLYKHRRFHDFTPLLRASTIGLFLPPAQGVGATLVPGAAPQSGCIG